MCEKRGGHLLLGIVKNGDWKSKLDFQMLFSDIQILREQLLAYIPIEHTINAIAIRLILF
jgi:hypothetical protein